MDWLDWIVRGAGGLFGLLTLAFGMSRATAFTERDVAPIWWALFTVVGAIWATALVASWLVPIDTTVYLTNGSDEARAALLGNREVCIPGKAYDGFTWRLGAPESVTVVEGGKQQRYAIGKGTWFINLSSTVVTADMYESGLSVAYDAVFASNVQAFKINSRYGRPFRMFSQLPMDRIYSADGDIEHASTEGPCPRPAPAQPAVPR